jgi:hypothetical protein
MLDGSGWMRGLRLRGPFALALAAISILPALALSQGVPIVYTASALACGEYRLSVNSTVLTERGPASRTETLGWDGQILVFAAIGSGGLIDLVAWFERLEIWSETPEGKTSPATGGLIGARYRGRLGATGVYSREAIPFMPEAIVMIADLSTTPDELFAPVPVGVLEPGEYVRDSLGWEFDRLSDTTWLEMPARRFRILRRDSTTVEADFGRGQIVEGTSVEVERGRMIWTELDGPVLWTRGIATTVSFPPATLTPEAVVTRIDQDRRVERVGKADAPRCPVE